MSAGQKYSSSATTAVSSVSSLHFETGTDCPQPTPSDVVILIVIQVNGKLRSRVTVPVDSSEEEIREIALSDEKARKWIESKEIKKVIVVPRKLVNVVVR